MKVKLKVEFDVFDTDDENVAKSAASIAAWNFLAFYTEVDGDVEVVQVHVDDHAELTHRRAPRSRKPSWSD